MVVGIIQARMNSKRLPGKILKKVCGKSLLELLTERLRCCKNMDEIVVATTVDSNDDKVEELAGKIGIKCFRGSENDVLDRFYQAATIYRADHIVRITGDCPLIDPGITNRVIDCYLKGLSGGEPYDYVSNTLRPTFPDGLDVEVFSFKMLKKLHHVSNKAYQREHVCTYMAEHPEEFRVKNVSQDDDLSHLRWTVDNAEDFELIKAIFEGLYRKNTIFSMRDILKFLNKHPSLSEINKGLKRNEGFVRSLNEQGFSEEEKKKIIDNVMNKRKLNEVL